MFRLLSLGLLLTPLAAPSHAATPQAYTVPAPTYCRVAQIVDYTVGISYRAYLLMAPECPSNAIGRIRKVTAGGAQIPGGQARWNGLWGWNMNAQTSLVPRHPEDARWSLFTTHWEWWDGRGWLPVIRP